MIQHPLDPDSSGFRSWACGAAGSAIPWHGRGRRFDPDQVHHFQSLTAATNFRGTCRGSGVRLARHYLAGMLKKNWGRIVFISSESGVQIPAEMVHYGMTKTAQIAVARGIAESVAGTEVPPFAVPIPMSVLD